MEFLSFLYDTAPGRILLRPLISRPVSEVCGRFLDSRLSGILIAPFARRHEIRTEDFDLSGVRSFNEFFCRPLKPGRRPVSQEARTLVAPCDGFLTAVPIRAGLVLPVKQSRFSIGRLLGDEELAKEWEGGLCLVFRLCVQHYHRYCYFDSGEKSRNRFIPGVFHTVRPVALQRTPVYTENSRDYTVLNTENFGRAVQMEIGAMLVGKIINEHPEERTVRRGEEKGRFAFGGSTILVLLKKDAVVLREDIAAASGAGVETPVRMGEAIGRAPVTE